MKTSTKGIALIKEFEGFRAKPYLCSAKVPTIGYGNTYYLDGKKVTLQDKPIDEGTATKLLISTVDKFEAQVNPLIKARLTQNQYDAIISFVYNLGIGNFKTSTLLKKININPNDITIANEFAKWVNAGGQRLEGLVKRRQRESQLYYAR